MSSTAKENDIIQVLGPRSFSFQKNFLNFLIIFYFKIFYLKILRFLKFLQFFLGINRVYLRKAREEKFCMSFAGTDE